MVSAILDFKQSNVLEKIPDKMKRNFRNLGKMDPYEGERKEDRSASESHIDYHHYCVEAPVQLKLALLLRPKSPDCRQKLSFCRRDVI